MSCLECRNGRLDCLEAAVKRAGVDAEWLWVKLRGVDVSPQLMRLSHAMGSQRWVGRVPRGRWELRYVGAGAEVDGPV